MQHAGSTNYKTDPGPPSQLTMCARRIASRLLVPEANELDTQVDSFLRYLDNRYADNAKDNRDTEVSKAARDDTRAGWRRYDGKI